MRLTPRLSWLTSRISHLTPRLAWFFHSPACSKLVGMTEHYFSAHPDSTPHHRSLRVKLRDRDFEVTVSDGVFAGHRLDKGTEVLLNKVFLSTIEEGDIVLDLGCGWGPISLALGTEYPQAKLWAVDVNDRARHLTEKNLRHHGIDAFVAAPEQALTALGSQKIRLIWSNPPIRIGKEQLHELLLTWLSLLAADGEAYLVVQKNLGADSLATWISQQGWDATKVRSSKGFRILRVAWPGNPLASEDA